ncbi:MAG: NAD-dependent epimerase/dehydratase family protein [Proteobacteria bacterium]|nr:NAD-dependent epimerase/dehydratase family protein [Pseudomonadota bacterium]
MSHHPDPSPGTALVTGGAGFIGSHIVDRLVADRWSVRVLDDFSSGREENLARSGREIELIRGDLCDPGTLEAATRGVEVIFHEGAIPSVPRSVADPRGTNAVNLEGTLGVLEAARRNGVRRVVLAASAAAYGDVDLLPLVESGPVRPLSPYALQKYGSELYCTLYASLYGLETVALRYFNVYGPRQDPASDYAAAIPLFVSAALEDRGVTVFGDGEQSRDFVYIDDVVEANLRAAAAPATSASGRVTNVASGRRTTVNELIEVLSDCVGHPIPVTHDAPRVGDIRHSWAEVSLARELLGWAPSRTLAEGLGFTVDAYKRGEEIG